MNNKYSRALIKIIAEKFNILEMLCSLFRIVAMGLLVVSTVAIPVRTNFCSANNSSISDFERFHALQKITENIKSYKPFLDTRADIAGLLSDYEKTQCVVIEKQFSECKDDLKIIVKLGVPTNSIKILQPIGASDLSKSIGAVAGATVGGSVGFGLAVLSLGMVGMPFVIGSAFVGAALGGSGVEKSVDKSITELSDLTSAQCEELKKY